MVDGHGTAGLLAVSARPVEAGIMTYTSYYAFETAIEGYNSSSENYGGLALGTTINAGETIDGLTYTAFTAGLDRYFTGRLYYQVR